MRLRLRVRLRLRFQCAVVLSAVVLVLVLVLSCYHAVVLRVGVPARPQDWSAVAGRRATLWKCRRFAAIVTRCSEGSYPGVPCCSCGLLACARLHVPAANEFHFHRRVSAKTGDGVATSFADVARMVMQMPTETPVQAVSF